MSKENDTTFINYLNLLLDEKDTNKRLNRINPSLVERVVIFDYKYYIQFKDGWSIWIKNNTEGYSILTSQDFYEDDETDETVMSYDRVCFYLNKLGIKYGYQYT